MDFQPADTRQNLFRQTLEVPSDVGMADTVVKRAAKITKNVTERVGQMSPVSLPALAQAEENIRGPAVRVSTAARRSQEGEQRFEGLLQSKECWRSPHDFSVDILQERLQLRRDCFTATVR